MTALTLKSVINPTKYSTSVIMSVRGRKEEKRSVGEELEESPGGTFIAKAWQPFLNLCDEILEVCLIYLANKLDKL